MTQVAVELAGVAIGGSVTLATTDVAVGDVWISTGVSWMMK